MKLYLIAIGQRMPKWVQQAAEDYIKRMPPHCKIVIREVAAGKRLKSTDVKRTVREEGERLLGAVPGNCRMVALDRGGDQPDTMQLAGQLKDWLDGGQDVALLVGGPEGLDAAVTDRCEWVWSLSALTFAHPLVRVILCEQLYRAWTVVENRPYHR